MELSLRNKVALITGASKGIGAATARCLASEGCDLILVARSRDRLEALKRDIEHVTASRVRVAPLDLSERGSARRLSEEFPNIDILVNNAGDDPLGTLSEINEENWRRAWDLKLFGYINMCREYYSHMKVRGGGVIINVIGVANIIKDSNYICGATSTAAISTLTQTLGGSSLKDGIRVVGVGPGVTATPRLLNSRDKFSEPFNSTQREVAEDKIDINGLADHIAQGFGLTRGGRPDEVAALIAFIASPQAGYITGSIVNTDGGWSRT